MKRQMVTARRFAAAALVCAVGLLAPATPAAAGVIDTGSVGVSGCTIRVELSQPQAQAAASVGSVSCPKVRGSLRLTVVVAVTRLDGSVARTQATALRYSVAAVRLGTPPSGFRGCVKLQAVVTAVVAGSASASATTGAPMSSCAIRPTPVQAEELGRQLVARRGWNRAQADCLDALFTRESNWRWNADNPSSDAYGIPQALPGSRMSAVGPDWQFNAETQITWGLNYIKGRYGTPCAAKAFSDRNGYY